MQHAVSFPTICRYFLGLAAAFLAASPVLAAETDGSMVCSESTLLARDVEEQLAQLMETHDYAGFSYSIVRAQDVVAAGGVGVANRNEQTPMTANTVFQIGSITKMFTGLVLARLAADDRIDLGDALSDSWAAENAVPTDTADRPITLQMLATHTSGLPRYPDNLDRIDGDPILGYSVQQLREGLSAVSVDGEFPRPVNYSNFGYGVLAEALARSQGVPFSRLLQDQVIDPMGLDSTRFSLSESMRPRLATPYRDDDVTIATEPWDMGAMSAAGGLFSTVADLGQFARWQLGAFTGALGARDAEARHLQRAPLYRYGGTPNWAYGLGAFVVDDYADGIDVIWHGGDVDGYAGTLVVLPDNDLAFAILTNVGKGDGFDELQRYVIARAVERCR
ncbi:MAG: serine hydrolase domain-containing protein [Pseudomonadota bacterium]